MKLKKLLVIYLVKERFILVILSMYHQNIVAQHLLMNNLLNFYHNFRPSYQDIVGNLFIELNELFNIVKIPILTFRMKGMNREKKSLFN